MRQKRMMATAVLATALLVPNLAAATSARAPTIIAAIDIAPDTDYLELKAKAKGIKFFEDLEGFLAAWRAVREKAVVLYGEDHPEVALADSEMAVEFFLKGDLQGALAVLEKTAEILVDAGPKYHADYMDTLNNIAVVRNEVGDISGSIEILERVLAFKQISEDMQDKKDVVSIMNNIAYAYGAMGNYNTALEYNAQAVEQARGFPDEPELESNLLANEPTYLARQGREEEAYHATTRNILRAVEILPKEHRVIALLLSTYAVILQNRGQDQQALETIRRATDMLSALYGADAPRLIEAQQVLLRLLLAQGYYVEAEVFAAEILPHVLRANGDMSTNYLDVLEGRDRARFLRLKDRQSQDALRETIEKAGNAFGKSSFEYIDSMLFLARAEFQLGQFTQTKTDLLAITETLYTEEISSIYQFEAEALLGLAQLNLGENEGRARVDVAFSATKVIYERAFRNNSRSYRATKTQQHVLSDALQAALFTEDVETAFAIAQLYNHSGARTSLAKAATRRDGLARKAQDLIRQRQDIIEAQFTAQNAFDVALRGDKLEATSPLKQQLAELEASLGAVDIKLDKEEPSWLAAEKPSRATLKTIQGNLQVDEMFLMPLITQSGIALFAVTKEKVTTQFIPQPRRRLRGLVKDVRQSVVGSGLLRQAATPASNSTGALGAYDVAAAHALYEAIFPEEIATLLDQKSTLFVVTNDALSLIPLAALVQSVTSTQKPRYLVETIAVTTLITPEQLGTKKRRKAVAFQNLIGMGSSISAPANDAEETRSALLGSLPALPGAAKELNAIAALGLSRRAKIYLGEGATEARFKGMRIGKRDLLLFATHGIIANELPGVTEPALILTPGDGQDGILLASEIATLNIPAKLVILSACNSGGADALSTEGLSGLVSGFLYAGTDVLMVSHWPIRDDAAAALTKETLIGVRDGLSYAQALQRSMVTLMRDPTIEGAAHPALWAGFNVIGH